MEEIIDKLEVENIENELKTLSRQMEVEKIMLSNHLKNDLGNEILSTLRKETKRSKWKHFVFRFKIGLYKFFKLFG